MSSGSPRVAALLAERGELPFKPTPISAVISIVCVGMILGYPFVAPAAMEAFGVRAVAGALLAVGGVTSLVLSGAPGVPRSWQVLRYALLAELAIAAATGSAWALLFAPALIYLALGHLCYASLSDEHSIAEVIARFIEPRAPDWIAAYCRKLTGVWSLLFVLNGALIGLLASTGSELWRSYTSWGVWCVVSALMVVELLFRKFWFRYYGPRSPLDRLLERVWPPAATERGRRSMAYIEQVEGGASSPAERPR